MQSNERDFWIAEDSQWFTKEAVASYADVHVEPALAGAKLVRKKMQPSTEEEKRRNE